MKNIPLLSQNLKLINHFYTKSLAKELSAMNLDHHFETLLVLARQQQPVTQKQLAQLLHVDKSRVVNIVLALEEKNMIIVETGPTDRRRHYVSLSPEALVFIPYIETKIQQLNQLVKTGISEKKLNIFMEVAETIMQNLIESNRTVVNAG